MLDAILRGDVATAERAVRAHLENGVDEIIRGASKEPDSTDAADEPQRAIDRRAAEA